MSEVRTTFASVPPGRGSRDGGSGVGQAALAAGLVATVGVALFGQLALRSRVLPDTWACGVCACEGNPVRRRRCAHCRRPRVASWMRCVGCDRAEIMPPVAAEAAAGAAARRKAAKDGGGGGGGEAAAALDFDFGWGNLRIWDGDPRHPPEEDRRY